MYTAWVLLFLLSLYINASLTGVYPQTTRGNVVSMSGQRIQSWPGI